VSQFFPILLVQLVVLKVVSLVLRWPPSLTIELKRLLQFKGAVDHLVDTVLPYAGVSYEAKEEGQHAISSLVLRLIERVSTLLRACDIIDDVVQLPKGTDLSLNL
jgi:hypothetical protein